MGTTIPRHSTAKRPVRLVVVVVVVVVVAVGAVIATLLLRSPDDAARDDAPPAAGELATVRTVTPVRTVPCSAGEEAGAGAVVRLDVRNGSGAPVDPSALTVTATTGDGVLAAPSPGGVAAPLDGPLPGGPTVMTERAQ